MILALAIFQVAAASGVPGAIDRVCGAYCEVLAVQGDTVRFIDQWPPARTLVLGTYARTAQDLVPRPEAPISDLRSPGGWRVVASVYLDHEEDAALTHLRFFNPSGELLGVATALPAIEQAEVGRLFGGADDVFATTSNEEHSYGSRTAIWLLPPGAPPKLLVEVQGTYERFFGPAAGETPGVTIARQTYDGVHPETKGTVREFYEWDRDAKSLRLRPR